MTLSLVLMTLAVARVTRLITVDVLFDEPRTWLVRKVFPLGTDDLWRHKIGYLLTCQWCASVYVGAAGAGAWYVWGETMPFMAITAALAASYVTGYLASTQEG